MRFLQSQLLDTWSYTVEFKDGNMTKLTANLIAEAMYSQCDPEGNQYILLEDITDHRKCETAISLADQDIDDLWLGPLLPMEGRVNLMGEIVRPKRVASGPRGQECQDLGNRPRTSF